MQNLEVIAGGAKEKADYRPTHSQYRRATEKAIKECEQQCGKMTFEEMASQFSEGFRKMVYASVKYLGAVRVETPEADEDFIQAIHSYVSCVLDAFGAMTPRQVMQLFPISKTYDGERWQCKDYFTTMKAINEIGIDNVIGEERAPRFLWSYMNWDIDEFMVTFMLTVSRMRVLQGGKDIMEEIFEEKGLPTYSYYENEGIMINRQTGEVTKVEKPRTRVPKYMKIIKGGLN